MEVSTNVGATCNKEYTDCIILIGSHIRINCRKRICMAIECIIVRMFDRGFRIIKIVEENTWICNLGITISTFCKKPITLPYL